MPTELEIKLKVESHNAARRRLSEHGAIFHGRIRETNRIFDDAGRTLLASGRGLRVRESRRENGELAKVLLTYKGRKEAGAMKRREEIECVVDDPEAAGSLLAALGFVEVLRFEKRRESWHWDSCEIELDEVPHLGFFIEIEGPDEQTIRRVQSELGLGEVPVIPNSYISLLVNHCQKNNLPANAIHF